MEIFRLFIFLYLRILIVIFTFLNFIIINLLFWWRIFLLITLIYLFLGKSSSSFTRIINYFVIQEFLGFLFLVFSGGLLQYLVLLLKGGVAPLHFWIFSVVGRVDSYVIIWFLTFQKMPFLPILVFLYRGVLFLFLLLGVVFCYLQIYILKSRKLIFVISSTESFSWILLGSIMGLWRILIFGLYYFFNIFFLISYLGSTGFEFLRLETFLVFLNLPLSVSFYLKIFMLNRVFFIFDFYLLFVLLLIFLSSLCLIFWFLNYSLKRYETYKDFYGSYSYLTYLLFFVVFFYRFSKNNYITLIGWSSLEAIKR